MRKENDFYPRVIASPSDGKVIDKRSYLENASLNILQVRTKEEIDHNEILDFEMISFEGHTPRWRPGQSGGPEKVS